MDLRDAFCIQTLYLLCRDAGEFGGNCWFYEKCHGEVTTQVFLCPTRHGGSAGEQIVGGCINTMSRHDVDSIEILMIGVAVMQLKR